MHVINGRISTRAAVSLSAVALSAVAIGWGNPDASAQGATTPQHTADQHLADTCRADVLNQVVQAVEGVTIKSIPNGPQFTGGTRFVAASGGVPAYCQVTGSFVTNPQSGKTANFLATLPANWNGKFLQLGCGQHCGSIMGVINNPAEPSNVGSSQGSPLQSVIRGYASFGKNKGHEGT